MENLDKQLFLFLNSLAGQSRFLDYLIIFLADYFSYLLVAIFLFLIFWKYKEKVWRILVLAISSILLSEIITQIIRHFYYHPRPFTVLSINTLISHSSTSSFPSGHSVVFFSLAFIIFYFNRRWGWFFIIGAILISLARIIAGVHWPLDIIGGAAVGFLSAFLVRKILRFK